MWAMTWVICTHACSWTRRSKREARCEARERESGGKVSAKEARKERSVGRRERESARATAYLLLDEYHLLHPYPLINQAMYLHAILQLPRLIR